MGDDGPVDGAMGSHAITFVTPGGDRVATRTEDDESLYSVAIAAGIDMGYGCFQGNCLSCLGRLRTGDVEHVRDPVALSAELLDEGFVLLCVATARSDCSIEIGAHLRAEAYPGLWDA